MSAIGLAIAIIFVGILVAWLVGRKPRLLFLTIDHVGMRHFVLTATYFVAGFLIFYEVVMFLIERM